MGLPTSAALNKKWQDPSKFRVTILPVGSVAEDELGVLTPDDVSAAIIGIDLASINTTPIEAWIGEEWRFATGRLEHYQIQLTFKDYNNFTLYRLWSRAIQRFTRAYPDDQKFDIIVETADDFNPELMEPTVTFKNCILITVSGPTLDNSANASIAEFSVTAKASYVETF